jgi:hypothetical protein
MEQLPELSFRQWQQMEAGWNRVAQEFQQEHPEICRAILQPGVHKLLRQGLSLAQIAELHSNQ